VTQFERPSCEKPKSNFLAKKNFTSPLAAETKSKNSIFDLKNLKTVLPNNLKMPPKQHILPKD
jgi:hypothetical protein